MWRKRQCCHHCRLSTSCVTRHCGLRVTQCVVGQHTALLHASSADRGCRARRSGVDSAACELHPFSERYENSLARRGSRPSGMRLFMLAGRCTRQAVPSPGHLLRARAPSRAMRRKHQSISIDKFLFVCLFFIQIIIKHHATLEGGYDQRIFGI